MKKLHFLLILTASFLIPDSFCLAQNRKIDSLITLIKVDKADTNKVNHLNQLTREFQSAGNRANALKYGKEALELAGNLDFKRGIAMLCNTIGNTYLRFADYPLALDYYFRALKTDEKLNNKKGIASHLLNIGQVYSRQSNYPKELEYYLKSLKIFEELKFKKGIARALGNIGMVYDKQVDYTKALDYYFKALKIAEELNEKNEIARHLVNIADIYHEQGNYQKAIDISFKSLKIAEELGDKPLQLFNLCNIGANYKEKCNYPNALIFDFKALKMSEEIDGKSLMAAVLGDIGQVYFKTGRFQEAEQYLKRSCALADSIGAKNYLSSFEESLSQLYDTTGRYNLALIHYKKAVALKDTIFSQENKKQLVRKEMQYDFDKKEEITKIENEAESRKQKIIILSVALGLLFVLVFAGFVVRSLRITRKQKNIIELQKNEVSHQKEEAEKQKEIVQEKQKEIVASITYAKRIQTALLTSDKYIYTYLPIEHFILFKPKDIVSGDFYWALSIAPLPGWDMGTNKIKLPADTKRQNTFYMVTADCTGHGVPGAFMSMLNISYLNENIAERGIRLPHDILNAQRKEIVQALNPEGSIDEAKDGMDCILCAYDFDKMLLHFAAANNPLWRIRDGELTEYKADKMPVGKYSEKMESFTLNTIELQKGDIIYTSTDGFADQFGTNGKKLMKKKFKEELLKIHHLPMAEQKEYLNQFFENWKGNAEQVDDVCVIGVRI